MDAMIVRSIRSAAFWSVRLPRIFSRAGLLGAQLCLLPILVGETSTQLQPGRLTWRFRLCMLPLEAFFTCFLFHFYLQASRFEQTVIIFSRTFLITFCDLSFIIKHINLKPATGCNETVLPTKCSCVKLLSKQKKNTFL